MYENILVPTDGHEYVEEALRHALEIASLSGGRIHGLYVIDTRDYDTLSETKWLEDRDELRERAEGALDTIRTACEDRNVPYAGEIERGIPHEVILDYAHENEIDMIAIATHGRTGVDHFLHGSVTEKVIRRAGIPVVVVHADKDIESRSRQSPE